MLPGGFWSLGATAQWQGEAHLALIGPRTQTAEQEAEEKPRHDIVGQGFKVPCARQVILRNPLDTFSSQLLLQVIYVLEFTIVGGAVDKTNIFYFLVQFEQLIWSLCKYFDYFWLQLRILWLLL